MIHHLVRQTLESLHDLGLRFRLSISSLGWGGGRALASGVSPSQLRKPVLDLQPRYTLKLSDIVGHERQPRVQSVGGDQQVIGANRGSSGLERGPQITIVLRGGSVEGGVSEALLWSRSWKGDCSSTLPVVGARLRSWAGQPQSRAGRLRGCIPLMTSKRTFLA